MNWGWFFLRTAIALSILVTLFLSQRYWYRGLWRITANWPSVFLRVVARLAYLVALLLVILVTADSFRMSHHGSIIPRARLIGVFSGLWFSSAFCAYVGVKFVRGVDLVWGALRKSWSAHHAPKPAAKPRTSALPVKASAAPYAEAEALADPSRRHFFRAATALAGATPFLGAVYGFAAERLNYQIRRVEIPVANLPSALDGMRVVQISDIHMSGYMTRTDVRRAVNMANELGGDLAVVTGDFITSASDPLADCIEEVSRLHAPLGVWGCNGNHEIYARAEDAAQELFAQAGMKLLRSENAQLSFRGAQFNMIGVDYQRERSSRGRHIQMLAGLEPLVRRDMPNILLSHNPNSFNRAAELGIELSLAGHTHGGQIQVEILDHRLSPARFITDYIAGYYRRPLFASAPDDRASHTAVHKGEALAAIYVNRGLGTVGAPVRLGVPPEITLLTLRHV